MSDGTAHQRCTYGIDVSMCKQKCDDDAQCKGYFMKETQRCQLSTTSDCGNSVPFDVGNVGQLDSSPTCEGGFFTPCYVKQGKIKLLKMQKCLSVM